MPRRDRVRVMGGTRGLLTRHPVTGRAKRGREWWCEHDRVVFHFEADRGSPVWIVKPDIEHLDYRRPAPTPLDFVRSDAYWSAVGVGLAVARAKVAAFIASPEFAALRDAYVAIPVDYQYRTWPADR